MGQFVFVIGFERCGTESIARILKASCRVGAFIAHEDKPNLCQEASLYMSGGIYRTKEFVDRMEKYRWLGRAIKLVCDANSRLGYFVEELSGLGNAKFVLLVRDPVETLVSRVASLAHWPEIIDRYPQYFQAAVFN